MLLTCLNIFLKTTGDILFSSGWRFWHYTWSFTCCVQRSVLSLGGTWICVNLQIAPLVGQEPVLTLKIVRTPKVEKKKKKKKKKNSYCSVRWARSRI